MEEIKTIEALYELIKNRKENKVEGSYTNYLFDSGIDKICKKIGEEATEVVIAAKDGHKDQVIYESSDLLYHLLVLFVYSNVKIEDIEKELEKRYERSREE
jgi:phosphoribosyl-ATP pyrophosphohydrolase